MDQLLQFMTQHWALWLALFILLALIIRVELSSSVSGVKMLTPAQVTQIMNRENAAFVDLRDSEIYKKGHVAGAINIPQSEVEQKRKKLDKFKTKPVIFSCANGQKAIKLATQLRKEGFEQVFGLKGGISAWQSESLPLVKD